MASRRRAALPAGATDVPASLPTRGPWRLLRGLVVAAVVLGLSLAGHVLAGGAAPWQAVAVLGVLTATLCVGLSGRQWGLGRLVALLGAAEVTLHLALTWAGERAAAGPVGMAADPMSGGAMSGGAMTGGAPSGDLMTGGAATGEVMAGMDGRTMLLGHAAALLLAAVFLRFGETRLWRLLAVILAPWQRDLRLAASRPTPPRPAALPPVPVPRVRTRLFADVLPRRGPPVPVA